MQFPRAIYTVWLSISVLSLLMVGCNSSDGDNGGEAVPQNRVTVRGEVNDGAAPIAGANCLLVNRQGVEQATSSANSVGEFDLQVLPEIQGFLQCAPPQFTQFHLSAFVSTAGTVAGDTVPAVGRELVSPQNTVVAIVIAQENPADPQARKEQLVAALAARDPDLTALVEATTILVQSMIDTAVDVAIDTSTGSDGNESDSGDGSAGGAFGDVNDGAEFSPIPRAVCEFVTSLQEEVIVDTALHDLFVDGQVTRPDLQLVAGLVNQALASRTTAIATAFVRLFPQGLGRPVRTIAADENAAEPGRYFLPIPPRLPGLVRCHPPDQDALLLLNSFPALQPGEKLSGQDITPATTLFSLQVATRLLDNLPALKENFEQDVTGLQVGIVQDNGQIRFELINDPTIGNNNVKLIAFVATALFNSFFKEGHNANFIEALRRWITDATVDPVHLAEDPALSLAQAETIANIINTSTDKAEDDLQITVDNALSTAQLRVRVRAARDGAVLPGATVRLAGNVRSVRCQNCPAVTNNSGEVVLNLREVPRERSTPLQVHVSLPDFRNKNVPTVVTAIATVTVEIALSRIDDNTGSGGGSN